MRLWIIVLLKTSQLNHSEISRFLFVSGHLFAMRSPIFCLSVPAVCQWQLSLITLILLISLLRCCVSCLSMPTYLQHCFSFEYRVENLRKYKGDGDDCPTLFCTDLAAWGLDLDVDHVVMFNFPLNSVWFPLELCEHRIYGSMFWEYACSLSIFFLEINWLLNFTFFLNFTSITFIALVEVTARMGGKGNKIL